MSRSRPASRPLSFHKPTGQYYVTRSGKRIYLGADQSAARVKYFRLSAGIREPLVLGRKNWLFSGSNYGGRTGAVLASLVATRKRHGVDPFACLKEPYSGCL